jgi:hypothetical protein
MKSKLLQKISYGVHQAREVVDGQKDSPLLWRGRTRLGATSPTGHADGDVRVSIHSPACGGGHMP